MIGFSCPEPLSLARGRTQAGVIAITVASSPAAPDDLTERVVALRLVASHCSRGVDELVVIDSDSTNRTAEAAAGRGPTVR